MAFDNENVTKLDEWFLQDEVMKKGDKFESLDCQRERNVKFD